jgi:hypothetical protein
MKVRVFARTPEGLFCVYKITRTSCSLCIISSVSAANRGDHFTYHRDGTCFHHVHGIRAARGDGIPWSQLKQPFTAISAGVVLFAPPLGARLDRMAKAEDIVINRDGMFGVEIIVAPEPVDLPEDSQRPARTVDVITSSPTVIIESFDIPDSTHRLPRFGSPVREWDWSRLLGKREGAK